MALNLEKTLDKVQKILELDTKRVREKTADPGFERAGTKIILPNDPTPMPILEAVGALLRYMEDEETVMDVVEHIEAYPMDAAVAFNQAMRTIYGWSSPVATPGFWGPSAPDLITVRTGPHPKDFVQVPWGSFRIPNVENIVTIGFMPGPVGLIFFIKGKVRKRERGVLVELANLTRAILKESSIYRGKSLQLTAGEDGELNPNQEPTFFDATQGVDLILNADELDQIQAALWTPIEFTDEVIKAQIPLKRGILLEGTYGIGKTLTARETARRCAQNGWTFIMLNDVRALTDALQFARKFEPAVVFAEDIDRLIEDDPDETSGRSQQGNDLLNVIDGVLSKNARVITVLTTNHVEKINRAMLRPGRFDAVVRMRPPGPAAVQRLIRLYGRDLIPATEGLDHVAEMLAGHIPATIREVVERSKLSMISGARDFVTAQDLLIAANGMQAHLDLLKEQPKDKSATERLGEAMGEVIRDANGLDKMEKTVERIAETVDMIAGN